MKEFKNKLKNLPLCPGVYLMKDIDGNIIYVGKSKLLKNRVSQYFKNTKKHSPKTLAMVESVNDFEYIITDTESEALALECNLIKKYRPKYNILLKDDKQYPYIKITFNEDFPRIFVTRKILKDGALYFGPYMNAYSIKNAVETIKKVFMVRSCNLKLPDDIGKKRPCLYYHLKQCSAPCSGNISKDDYRETFNKISDVLKGNIKEINKIITERMNLASDSMQFEKAAILRDKLLALKELNKEQKISNTNNENMDILGYYSENDEYCIQLFYVRNGKVVGSEHFTVASEKNNEKIVLETFVKQFYFTQTNIPKEIVIPLNLEDEYAISNWFSDICGHKVKFIVPKKGKKLNLLNMVSKNAKEVYMHNLFIKNKDVSYQNRILKECAELLNLEKIPHRIECFDISNISGVNSVGAQIVFKNAIPFKNAYRIYNIKELAKLDDYESMKQVIYRRMNEFYKEEDLLKDGKITEDKTKFSPLPDLILLDGGKGHVSVVKELLEGFGEDIPIFGLVKDSKHKTSGITDGEKLLEIDKKSELFLFFTKIQEEVHKFAINRFRNKHEKNSIKSELENINGVGPKKRKALLNSFKSIKNIKKASVEELSKIVDKKTAGNIFEFYNHE